MSTESQSLEDIQDAILDRFHAGERIDRAALLAEHPEHAGALKRFLQVMNVLEEPAPLASDAHSRLGDYEIRQEIGRGGMGVVYEALQLSLKRPVALKILPPALRFDRQLLKRFQREAEAAGRLRHPNIVPVYTTGEAGGAPFFAMELVDGHSLAQLLATWRGAADDAGSAASVWHRNVFDDEATRVRWCVELMARVLDALDYAHGQGIIHRDVKPGNILVESDGTPRLTDFGLALDMDASELTLAGEVFGSPLYMSPEQAQRANAPLDARTDIYSVAVTLYELVTLRLPYEGDNRASLLGALADGRILPPRDAHAEVSPALDAVLLRALQHEPGLRYRSAAEFARALRSALAEPEEIDAAGALAGVGAAGPRRVAAPSAPGPSPAVAAAATEETETSMGRRAVNRAGRRSSSLIKVLFVMGVLGVGALLLFVIPAVFLLSGTSVQPAPPPVMLDDEPAATTPQPAETADDVDPSPGGPTVTASDLRLLADAQHPEGRALLDRWLSTARLEVRDRLGREEDGLLRVVWPHVGPSLKLDYWMGVRLQVSVDGMPWQPGEFVELHMEPDPSDTLLALMGNMLGDVAGDNVVSLERNLTDVLSAEDWQRDTLLLRVRFTVRLQPLDGASTAVDFHGTESHWHGQRLVEIVDGGDLRTPVRVFDDGHRAGMRAMLTPSHVELAPPEEGKSPVLSVFLQDELLGPLPGAFDVSVRAPEVDPSLRLGGRALLTPVGVPDTSDGEPDPYELRIPMDADVPAVASVLALLREGGLDRLEIRFEPSHALARREPTLERYWGEAVVVSVPVGG